MIINIKPVRLDSLGLFPKNFDIRETRKKFPYNLSIFGMLEEHQLALLRFHILFQLEALQFPDFPLGFSFPLCGSIGEEKDSHIFQLIGRQDAIFPNFLGSKKLSELVIKRWSTSKVFVIPKPDYKGTRHTILTTRNCGLQDYGYLYIHDYSFSKAYVLAKGHYH